MSKLTMKDLRGRKGREKIVMLTAYDYVTARLIDEAGIPMILVGDTLGMVVLGFGFVRVWKDKLTFDNYQLLENGGLYWHLVDIIWIFLFPLFYLIT